MLAADGGVVTSGLAIGDAVFCPGHGLGVVCARGLAAPLGVTREYLTIDVLSAGMTLKVPLDEAVNAGLRRPASRQALRDALHGPVEVSAIEMAWKTRIKRNGDRIASGDVHELGEVARELSYLAVGKALSVRERDQLAIAVQQLVSEWMLAFGVDEPGAHAALDEALAGRVVATA
jgi:CarD family transcriptional regulator